MRIFGERGKGEIQRTCLIYILPHRKAPCLSQAYDAICPNTIARYWLLHIHWPPETRRNSNSRKGCNSSPFQRCLWGDWYVTFNTGFALWMEESNVTTVAPKLLQRPELLGFGERGRAMRNNGPGSGERVGYGGNLLGFPLAPSFGVELPLEYCFGGGFEILCIGLGTLGTLVLTNGFSLRFVELKIMENVRTLELGTCKVFASNSRWGWLKREFKKLTHKVNQLF